MVTFFPISYSRSCPVLAKTTSGGVCFNDTFQQVSSKFTLCDGCGFSHSTSYPQSTSCPSEVLVNLAVSFHFFLTGILCKIYHHPDGRQVLKYSFDNFVYERSVLDVPFGWVFHLFLSFFLMPRIPPFSRHYKRANDRALPKKYRDEHLFTPRYPPYTAQSLAFFEGVLGTPIPVLEDRNENN